MSTTSKQPSSTPTLADQISEAIENAFAKCNLADVSADQVNVVDGLFSIASAIRDLAKAIRESRPQ